MPPQLPWLQTQMAASFGVERGRSLKEIEEQAIAAPAAGLVFGAETETPRGAPAPARTAGKSGGRRHTEEGVEAG